jgi:AcrR family transcriptional regulator
VNTKGPAFLRARQPAQKQQRYQAILDAARTLARRDGVSQVSLAGIAAEVGLHKSALLTYFGTREEIFLRVAETEWQEWAGAIAADLASEPGDNATEHVVTTLERSLADRPLLCQLLTHTTLTLERNVSLDAVRSFKSTTIAATDHVTDALHRALPSLPRAACAELLMSCGLVAGRPGALRRSPSTGRDGTVREPRFRRRDGPVRAGAPRRTPARRRPGPAPPLSCPAGWAPQPHSRHGSRHAPRKWQHGP